MMQYHHLKLPNRSAYSKIDCRLTFAVLVARYKQQRNWETAVRALNEVWRDHFGKDYCELDVKAEDLDNHLPTLLHTSNVRDYVGTNKKACRL